MDGILQELARERAVPIFGIASAEGFEHALPGWHPKELMPRCNSVVIFGRPFVQHPYDVDEKTHIIDPSWFAVNEPVYRGVAEWRGDLVNLFDQFGLGAASFGGFWISSEPTLSYRLAQYEAGVGVFGRFGVCLNPDFGCNYYVGVLLTEAELIPTDKDKLAGFEPCDGCSLCAEVCPVRAIDASKAPAAGYNMELCFRFILKLRQRYETDPIYRYEEAKFCGRCFSVCPWATTTEHRGPSSQSKTVPGAL
jgi:epoxyqueuosine reductase QueG